MRPGTVKLNAAALMATAALGLHELRYVFGYRADAANALEHQGHAYLSYAGFAAGLVLAVALALLVVRIARAKTEEDSPSLALTWAVASVGLVLIYVCQELAEGLLSSGHPGGVTGVFGNGGVWALPLAVVLGGVVALALHGAGAAVRAAIARRARAERRTRGHAVRPPAARDLVPAAPPLARHLAGRAPPLPS